MLVSKGGNRVPERGAFDPPYKVQHGASHIRDLPLRVVRHPEPEEVREAPPVEGDVECQFIRVRKEEPRRLLCPLSADQRGELLQRALIQLEGGCVVLGEADSRLHGPVIRHMEGRVLELLVPRRFPVDRDPDPVLQELDVGCRVYADKEVQSRTLEWGVVPRFSQHLEKSRDPAPLLFRQLP